MKSYNGSTRSMIQIRNQTTTLFDVMAKEDIKKLLAEDKSMTKHRLKIQFNDPPEAYYAEVIAHLFGPFTDKMIAADEAFVKELGDELKEPPGPKSHVFFQLSIAMKPGQKKKYEGYCEKLLKLFNENKPSGQPEIHLKLYAFDDRIDAKFLVSLTGYLNPLRRTPIPMGLKEALKDTDQFIKLKIIMGADAEEILT